MLANFIEKALNTYLKLDPYTLAEINSIKEKSVLLKVTDFEWAFLLSFNGAGIKVEKALDVIHADVIITGSSVYLFFSSFNLNTSAEKNITIEGDVELGYQISNLLKNIEIDWEEHLSKITGDIFAHEVGKLVTGFKQTFKSTQDRLSSNIRDYLHEESELFPNPKEVSLFYHNIQTLKQDVERLEARIKLANPTHD